MNKDESAPPAPRPKSNSTDDAPGDAQGAESAPREIGGPRGKEPTRYGDWEKNGRCIDF